MANNDIKVGLVIMASGLGKRFGRNKLMTNLNEKPLIKWIIDTTDNCFDKRVVVTRSSEVKKLCEELGIDCIQHEFPGRNDTVRLGLERLMTEASVCFFSPGDQPLIKKNTIEKLIAYAKENPEKIIRTKCGELVGTPTGFPKSVYHELLSLPEKCGGNYVVKKHPEMVEFIEAGDESELWDVDTISDLEKVKEYMS